MSTPEKGFYYHYKHDSQNGVVHCAYEVVGNAFSIESAGVHSENPEDFFKDEVVVYRPLFPDSLVLKADRNFWVRPIKMFLEDVVVDGKTMSRFMKITNPEIIVELEKIRDAMYN